MVAHIYYVLWNSIIDSGIELEHIIIFDMVSFINEFLNYYIMFFPVVVKILGISCLQSSWGKQGRKNSC